MRVLRYIAVSLMLTAMQSVLAVKPSQGKVVGILDGDTIDVTRTVQGKVRQFRVRLHGIDAPERGQPFAEKAKQFLSKHAFGKIVDLYPKSTDRYGRLVAAVYVGGRSLNLMLVEHGLAWWYRAFAPDDKRLESAEEKARRARRGLWSDRRSVAPWEYRRGKRAG